jgi:hypothetical protein
MKRILKTLTAISLVATAASAAPIAGAFAVGAMMGGMATSNYHMSQPQTNVYYDTPQVVYEDTIVHPNGMVTRQMSPAVSPMMSPVSPVVMAPSMAPSPVVTVQQPMMPTTVTQTTRLSPTVTYTKQTTYVQPQPTVTVVETAPTVVYQPAATVINTSPSVIVY